MNLSFLKENSTTNIKMNVDFVEMVKACLDKSSKSVELTVKNIDDMLGLRIQIYNRSNDKHDFESAVDEDFFNAVLNALVGKTDDLLGYQANDHSVCSGRDFKIVVLDDFLQTKFPFEVKTITTMRGRGLIEVTFKVAYRRKLKIYFSKSDMNAIAHLKEKGLLQTED